MVRRTWYTAYAGVYGRGEMDAVFTGRIEQHAPWGVRRSRSLLPYAAEVDGAVVGIAAPALLSDGDGELVALYVLPEHQGRGVGLALWRAASAGLRDAGCRRMWVWVLERNPAAVRWYERRGCAAVDRGVYSIGRHDEPTLGMVVDLHGPE